MVSPGILRGSRGAGIVMMAWRCMVVLVVLVTLVIYYCRRRLFRRPARRLHGGGKPLQGKRGQQEPEQECLDETMHF
jgi:hypothetical protein